LYLVFACLFSCTAFFVSISQVIGGEDRLRNDLYCVGWGVKLCSTAQLPSPLFSERRCCVSQHLSVCVSAVLHRCTKPQLHAALVSAAKVMHCIQCSPVIGVTVLWQCILWNTATGERLNVIAVHPDTIFSISWNHDGSLFATTCKDKQIRVIDPRRGAIVAVRLQSHFMLLLIYRYLNNNNNNIVTITIVICLLKHRNGQRYSSAEINEHAACFIVCHGQLEIAVQFKSRLKHFLWFVLSSKDLISRFETLPLG